MSQDRKVAVVGLGYVGLPVAVAFARQSPVIGFDINAIRINELKRGYDNTHEVSADLLLNPNITFTADSALISAADFYIVTVPTPIDNANKPDLSCLYQACKIIGAILKPEDIVVFESTVYPGVIEEECLPLLERHSKLIAGIDFGVGYSPERINTGDKQHTFENITKVIAALDPLTLEIIATVYGKVVRSLYRAPSIKVAEAAKVIENTQRDLNIALMNELAILFKKMDIDTHEVLECAKTKWNFFSFEPGLVGGHCIGVDPYYLTYKAKQLGYRPEVILAGRRINDGMGKVIADETVKKLILKGAKILGAKVAILGLTFKENCRDLRNSKVIDVINELKSFGVDLLLHDPIADFDEALKEYDLELSEWDDIHDVDALVLCVAHKQYRELSAQDYNNKLNRNKLIMDVKSILNRDDFGDYGVDIWRL